MRSASVQACPKGGRAALACAGNRRLMIAISRVTSRLPLRSSFAAAAAIPAPRGLPRASETDAAAALSSRLIVPLSITAAAAIPSEGDGVVVGAADAPTSASPPLSPSARAADTVTRFYSAWNAADPDGAVLDMAPDVEYWDTIYEKPFVGREAVRAYFAKAARVLGPAVRFVVDGLSPAEDGSAVGVKWHCELDDGTPLPNSRGCSFYELRDSGATIARARDFVEPAVKPGAATLYLLRAVLPLVRLAARFDSEKKGGGGGGGGGGTSSSSSGGGSGGGDSGGGDSGGGNSLASSSGGLDSVALAFAGNNGLAASPTSLPLFGGSVGKKGSSSSSGSSGNSQSSSRSRSSPPPPPPLPPSAKPPAGSLTPNSALVWLFYVAYFSFVFVSRELPGLPVLETPPEVLTEVLHESWTFYYLVPLLNLAADAAALPAGMRLPDLPEHPASEALFNFVNAWSMMMLPVMLSEAPRALPSPGGRGESGGGGGGGGEGSGGRGGGDAGAAAAADKSSSAAFKWWLGVQFLTNVFMIPYMALRAREGGPGNDLVPESWRNEKGSRSSSGVVGVGVGGDGESEFPSWTPAIGLAGASIGVLSVLWALYARPETAAELGRGLASAGAPGDSLEGRWAWAAAALSTNRATWAFALDASLYAVWQAAMLKEASPLERFVPFFGMAAFLMRRGGGGGGEKERREEKEA